MDVRRKSNEKQMDINGDVNNDVGRTLIALVSDAAAHDAINTSLRRLVTWCCKWLQQPVMRCYSDCRRNAIAMVDAMLEFAAL
jgi:hypothetical protein